MKVGDTALTGVKLVQACVHADDRGYFLESFNARDFQRAIGRAVHFTQDNHSHSVRGVLRGLHYQLERPQAKLVRVPRI